jgi:hypothetical protein
LARHVQALRRLQDWNRNCACGPVDKPRPRPPSPPRPASRSTICATSVAGVNGPGNGW